MVDIEKLIDGLKDLGIGFFTGVPDSLLNDFCLYLSGKLSKEEHIMAANEGNAIAIAAGNYLATGNVPVVYMQNSGIGNATNPLLSLAHPTVYSVPMILVIGWRGDPSVSDHAQHKRQGELTTVLMQDMNIPFRILDEDDSVLSNFAWAKEKACQLSSPVALIVKKGILAAKVKKQRYLESDLLNREEAIEIIVNHFKDKAIYLATTGRATRELHEQLLIQGVPCGHEFLNVGSMGHVTSVALGLATGNTQGLPIVCFDGDSACIMHMGSMATIGRYQPSHLLHIVLNNGVNESVGGQPSAGQMVKLTDIAKACGYFTVGKQVETKEEILDSLRLFENEAKPCFLDIHVRQGIRSDMPKLAIDHKRQIQELRNIFK